MKLPLSWLREHTPIAASASEIAATLVRLGHEIESIESPRKAVEGVVVGRILSLRPHPNADRLKLLQVDINAAEPLAIVCGATNMRQGDKVPVATVGARLPNGLTIKKSKIRGETSFGMCCSETELGLADESEGLMILPPDAPVGMNVGDYLGLEEAIFDLSITPNRGDCMSVRGIARELAADADLPLLEIPGAEIPIDDGVRAFAVKVAAPEDCPLYLARRIEGVRLGESPDWLKKRLIAAGQRPVNGVVDVLNYVMLDLGQPMHAFDADRLQGGMTVRPAREGEAFVALDGRKLKLCDGDLVIADERSVVALAGIVGAAHSGVHEQTRNVLLESAFFRPARISITRRVHGLVSEASMRFERGVDPAMVETAMQRATAMIVELFGGRAGGLVACGDVGALSGGAHVECSLSRLQSRLGIAIPEHCDAVLARMGFDVRREGDRIAVNAPSWRHDIRIPEDLSEEYARIIGFDAIPAELSAMRIGKPPKADNAIADAVADGFAQVVTYAFISAEEQRLFIDDDGADIVLANPLSDAMAVMRRGIWPGLLNVARYNLNRRQPGVALVEQGRGYRRTADGHREINLIAWLMAGEVQRDEWFAKARQADFFDLKGAVESWLEKRGLTARFVADDEARGLQPGQSARILVGRNMVGRIGRVDAAIAARFDIEAPVFVAEIDLDALPAAKPRRFAPLPEFPGVERDLVFLFKRGVEAELILQTVRKAGGELLTDARIFDLYEGQGVPEGYVSIGVRLTLQDPKRTLVQQEMDQVMKAVIEAVEKRFAATLRG